MFAAEAEGSPRLREAGAVRVPRVDRAGRGRRALVARARMARARAARRRERRERSAHALAAQHRIAQRDASAGRATTSSAPRRRQRLESDDWLAFWRDHRLHAQLRLAAANRLPSRMIDRGERLAADCGAFFRDYAPARSLLHGDLWSGNAAALRRRHARRLRSGGLRGRSRGRRRDDGALRRISPRFPCGLSRRTGRSTTATLCAVTSTTFTTCSTTRTSSRAATCARRRDAIEKLLAEIA